VLTVHYYVASRTHVDAADGEPALVRLDGLALSLAHAHHRHRQIVQNPAQQPAHHQRAMRHKMRILRQLEHAQAYTVSAETSGLSQRTPLGCLHVDAVVVINFLLKRLRLPFVQALDYAQHLALLVHADGDLQRQAPSAFVA
jgi:hypothetical protein